MAADRKIKIGTRGSRLALAQANLAAAALERHFPKLSIEMVILRTKGDKILDKPLLELGGKGLFITEFEEALLDGTIDLAIHSAKDMPADFSKGLVIAGTLPREDARDVLVMKKGQAGRGSFLVGTGSPRRQIQIKELYPKAVCKGLRGNVTTRLEKLRNGEYDGIVLAAAGLKRLGLLGEEDLEYRFLSFDEMVPAGGQGIIAVEGRKGDNAVKMVQQISDSNAFAELALERDILRMLDADCHGTAGVVSQHTGKDVQIHIIWENHGQLFRKDGTGNAAQGQELGKEFVRQIKEGGMAG